MVVSSQQPVASRKIKNFTDLETWQISHQLVVAIYKLTQKFPSHELYGITNQMRRSAVSITSNIAEGFGRRAIKEKLHFYSIAEGSQTELLNQLMVSRDVGFISAKVFSDLQEMLVSSQKMLSGLIRSIRKAAAA